MQARQRPEVMGTRGVAAAGFCLSVLDPQENSPGGSYLANLRP